MVITDLRTGLSSFLHGVRWLRHQPRQCLLLMLPATLSLLVLVGGLFFFFSQAGQWFQDWLGWQQPEASWTGFGGLSATLGYYALLVLFYLVSLVVWTLLCLMLVAIVSSPVYEAVSVAYEKSRNAGRVVEISFWKSLSLMGEEIKKFLLIASISVAALLIPGLNLLGFAIAGFLVAWDLYDYPLARRGFSFSKRLRYLRRDFFKILGMGIWLMIPFASFLIMPLAVPGASRLSLAALDRDQPLDA